MYTVARSVDYMDEWRMESTILRMALKQYCSYNIDWIGHMYLWMKLTRSLYLLTKYKNACLATYDHYPSNCTQNYPKQKCRIFSKFVPSDKLCSLICYE